MASPFPPRSKGMWQRTYERLKQESFQAEMLAQKTFLVQMERRLTRIDNPKRKRTF